MSGRIPSLIRSTKSLASPIRRMRLVIPRRSPSELIYPEHDEHSNMTKAPTIVGLGEVLWDLLPSGKQLGGAPANFAYMANLLAQPGGTLVNELRLQHSDGSWRDFEIVATNKEIDTDPAQVDWAWLRLNDVDLMLTSTFAREASM